MAEPKSSDSTSSPTALPVRSASETRTPGISRLSQNTPGERASSDSDSRLSPESMPRDFSISLQNSVRGGTDRLLLQPSTERRQPMRGFDPKYVDIIDYIVRITHRIWEEKNIGYIYDVYRHNCRVVDDAGLQYGRDKIVADTVHTINAFPDIRLYADEIVWAGNEDVGFFTSHRTVITGTNSGWSRFGPPTNRRVTVWCIANCLSQDNEIFEEWVIYNQSSMLRQLGFDLIAKAREFGNQRVRSNAPAVVPTEPTRLEGQGKPRHLPEPSARFDLEGEIRRAHHYAWNWRNLGALDRFYDERLIFHGPTDRELRGLSAYKSFVLSLIAMFPDIASRVDEIYWMGNDTDGYLTAVRWSAIGTHRGFGPYGTPTGRQIRLWGLTQQHVVGGKVREEWMVFNEFDVLQQIFADEPI
jgi:predicted ester cyclase